MFFIALFEEHFQIFAKMRQEYSMDVDITQFLRLMSNVSDIHNENRPESDAIHSDIQDIIASYFTPIPGTHYWYCALSSSALTQLNCALQESHHA